MRLLAIAAGCAALLPLAAAAGTSFVVEAFDDPAWGPGTNWVRSGSFIPAAAYDADQVPNTALRLTPNANSQYAAIEYTTPQPTSAGLDISFNLAIWGGNGADGMTLFLRKGSTASTTPGARGGSLGYSSNQQGGDYYADGMPGGLIGVGFDLWGSYSSDDSVFGGTDCPAATYARNGHLGGYEGNVHNSIVIRGPGAGHTGYCRLNGTQSGIAFDAGASTRSARTRAVRVTVDPSTAASPLVSVYYSPDATTANWALAVTAPVPAELLAEPTFKFGFTAGTGGLNNIHEVMGLTVSSLDPLAAITITTDTLPAGTVGAAYSSTVGVLNGVSPLTFLLSGWPGPLPDGLSLEKGTGRVSGTPTTAGWWTVVVSVADSRTPSSSSTTHMYTIVINAAPTVTAVTPATASAVGGVNVTITGTSFTPATAFKINGVVCTSFAVVSATQITCGLPSSFVLGAVAVSVVTPDITVPATGLFAYAAPGTAPTLTGVAPASATTDGNVVVTLSGTYLAWATAATIGSVPCTSLVVDVGSAVSVTAWTINCTVPAAQDVGSVDVGVTTPDGSTSLPAAFAYITPSPSASLTPSVTASGSGSASITASASASESFSASYTPSLSATASETASVSGSSSLSATASMSASVTASVTGSVTASGSLSASVSSSLSASASVSASVSASATASASVTASQSASASVTASRSASVSVTASSSASASVTASHTPTPSRTPSITPTASPSFVPFVPKLGLNLTLLGGTTDTLRTSVGAALRKAVAALTGVQGAASTFKSVSVSYSDVNSTALRALGNGTAANGTALGGSAVAGSGSVETINATDASLNGQLYNRRLLRLLHAAATAAHGSIGADAAAAAAAARSLQSGSGASNTGSCTPVNLTLADATIRVPTASVDIEISLPAAYFVSLGAVGNEGMQAVIRDVQASLQAMLANHTALSSVMGGFLAAWANCTGLPVSLGVIAALSAPVVQANAPVVVPVSSTDGAAIGGALGGVLAAFGIAILLLWLRPAWLCCCCRGAGAAAGEHSCSSGWDLMVVCPAANLLSSRGVATSTAASAVAISPFTPAPGAAAAALPAGSFTVHVCKHMTLREATAAALARAGLPVSEEALQAAALRHAGRRLAVASQGDATLAKLQIAPSSTTQLNGSAGPAGAAGSGIVLLEPLAFPHRNPMQPRYAEDPSADSCAATAAATALAAPGAAPTPTGTATASAELVTEV